MRRSYFGLVQTVHHTRTTSRNLPYSTQKDIDEFTRGKTERDFDRNNDYYSDTLDTGVTTQKLQRRQNLYVVLQKLDNHVEGYNTP